jgi:ubiquinone/menaquinone biosynthesis C-methylase UbiE
MGRMNMAEKAVVNNGLYNFFYGRLLVRRFLRWCRPSGRCLEIGCGPGYTSMEIARLAGVELTATDYDGEEVERAKKLFRMQWAGDRRPKALQADGTALPFRDGTFDCVVEMMAFHHIGRFPAAVSESYRVLRKGGRLCMMDISRYFLWPLTALLPFEHFDGKFTKRQMMEELVGAGFRMEKQEGHDIFMLCAVK